MGSPYRPAPLDNGHWQEFLSQIETVKQQHHSGFVVADTIILDAEEPTDGNATPNEELIVLSSDSEDEEDAIWTNNHKGKTFKRLREKARLIILHQMLSIYSSDAKDQGISLEKPEDHLFPYTKLHELSEDLRHYQQHFKLSEDELSFLWSSVMQWLSAVKLSTDTVDLNNDERFNLLMVDFMAQYIDYITKAYSYLTNKQEIEQKVRKIVQTMSIFFNGSLTHMTLTLLRIDLKMEYGLILDPIFKLCLINDFQRRTSSDFVVYLRLVFCFRRWKLITLLKPDRERINDYAIGKLTCTRRNEMVEVEDRQHILPKVVPLTNAYDRVFVTISDLILFAIRDKKCGSRRLLMYTTISLDDAIAKYFDLYERYVTGRLAPNTVPESALLDDDDTTKLHTQQGTDKVADKRSSQPQQELRKRQPLSQKEENTSSNRHLTLDCDTQKTRLSTSIQCADLCTINNSIQSDISLRHANENLKLDIIELDSTDEDDDDLNSQCLTKSNNASNAIPDCAIVHHEQHSNLQNSAVQKNKPVRLAKETFGNENTCNNTLESNAMSLDSSTSDEDVVAPVPKPTATLTDHSKKPESNQKTQNELRQPEPELGPQRFVSLPSRCRMLLKSVATKPTRKEKHCIPGEVSSTTSPDNVGENSSSTTAKPSNSESLEVHSAGNLQNAREVGTVKVVEQRVSSQPVVLASTMPGGSLLGIDYSGASSEDGSDDEENDNDGANVLSSSYWKVVEEATSSTEIFQKTQFTETGVSSASAKSTAVAVKAPIVSDLPPNIDSLNTKSVNEQMLNDMPTCSKYLQNLPMKSTDVLCPVRTIKHQEAKKEQGGQCDCLSSSESEASDEVAHNENVTKKTFNALVENNQISEEALKGQTFFGLDNAAEGLNKNEFNKSIAMETERFDTNELENQDKQTEQKMELVSNVEKSTDNKNKSDIEKGMLENRKGSSELEVNAGTKEESQVQEGIETSKSGQKIGSKTDSSFENTVNIGSEEVKANENNLCQDPETMHKDSIESAQIEKLLMEIDENLKQTHEKQDDACKHNEIESVHEDNVENEAVQAQKCENKLVEVIKKGSSSGPNNSELERRQVSQDETFVDHCKEANEIEIATKGSESDSFEAEIVPENKIDKKSSQTSSTEFNKCNILKPNCESDLSNSELERRQVSLEETFEDHCTDANKTEITAEESESDSFETEKVEGNQEDEKSSETSTKEPNLLVSVKDNVEDSLINARKIVSDVKGGNRASITTLPSKTIEKTQLDCKLIEAQKAAVQSELNSKYEKGTTKESGNTEQLLVESSSTYALPNREDIIKTSDLLDTLIAILPSELSFNDNDEILKNDCVTVNSTEELNQDIGLNDKTQRQTGYFGDEEQSKVLETIVDKRPIDLQSSGGEIEPSKTDIIDAESLDDNSCHSKSDKADVQYNNEIQKAVCEKTKHFEIKTESLSCKAMDKLEIDHSSSKADNVKAHGRTQGVVEKTDVIASISDILSSKTDNENIESNNYDNTRGNGDVEGSDKMQKVVCEKANEVASKTDIFPNQYDNEEVQAMDNVEIDHFCSETDNGNVKDVGGTQVVVEKPIKIALTSNILSSKTENDENESSNYDSTMQKVVCEKANEVASTTGSSPNQYSKEKVQAMDKLKVDNFCSETDNGNAKGVGKIQEVGEKTIEIASTSNILSSKTGYDAIESNNYDNTRGNGDVEGVDRMQKAICEKADEVASTTASSPNQYSKEKVQAVDKPEVDNFRSETHNGNAEAHGKTLGEKIASTSDILSCKTKNDEIESNNYSKRGNGVVEDMKKMQKKACETANEVASKTSIKYNKEKEQATDKFEVDNFCSETDNGIVKDVGGTQEVVEKPSKIASTSDILSSKTKNDEIESNNYSKKGKGVEVVSDIIPNQYVSEKVQADETKEIDFDRNNKTEPETGTSSKCPAFDASSINKAKREILPETVINLHTDGAMQKQSCTRKATKVNRGVKVLPTAIISKNIFNSSAIGNSVEDLFILQTLSNQLKNLSIEWQESSSSDVGSSEKDIKKTEGASASRILDDKETNDNVGTQNKNCFEEISDEDIEKRTPMKMRIKRRVSQCFDFNLEFNIRDNETKSSTVSSKKKFTKTANDLAHDISKLIISQSSDLISPSILHVDSDIIQKSIPQNEKNSKTEFKEAPLLQQSGPNYNINEILTATTLISMRNEASECSDSPELKSILKKSSSANVFKTKKRLKYDEDNLLQLQLKKSTAFNLKTKARRTAEGALRKGGNKNMKKRLIELNACFNQTKKYEENLNETEKDATMQRQSGEISISTPSEDTDIIKNDEDKAQSAYPILLTSRRESMNPIPISLECVQLSPRQHVKIVNVSNSKGESILIPANESQEKPTLEKAVSDKSRTDMNRKNIINSDGIKVKLKTVGSIPGEEDAKEKHADKKESLEEQRKRLIKKKAFVKIKRLKVANFVKNKDMESSLSKMPEVQAVKNMDIESSLSKMPEVQAVKNKDIESSLSKMPEVQAVKNEDMESSLSKMPEVQAAETLVPLQDNSIPEVTEFSQTCIKIEPIDNEQQSSSSDGNGNFNTEIETINAYIEKSKEPTISQFTRKSKRTEEIVLKPCDVILTADIINAQAEAEFKRGNRALKNDVLEQKLKCTKQENENQSVCKGTEMQVKERCSNFVETEKTNENKSASSSQMKKSKCAVRKKVTPNDKKPEQELDITTKVTVHKKINDIPSSKTEESIKINKSQCPTIVKDVAKIPAITNENEQNMDVEEKIYLEPIDIDAKSGDSGQVKGDSVTIHPSNKIEMKSLVKKVDETKQQRQKSEHQTTEVVSEDVQSKKGISSKEKVSENKPIIILEKSINEKLALENNTIEDRSAEKCIKPKEVLRKTKSTSTTDTSTVKKTAKLKEDNKSQKGSSSKQNLGLVIVHSKAGSEGAEMHNKERCSNSGKDLSPNSVETEKTNESKFTSSSPVKESKFDLRKKVIPSEMKSELELDITTKETVHKNSTQSEKLEKKINVIPSSKTEESFEINDSQRSTDVKNVDKIPVTTSKNVSNSSKKGTKQHLPQYHKIEEKTYLEPIDTDAKSGDSGEIKCESVTIQPTELIKSNKIELKSLVGKVNETKQQQKSEHQSTEVVSEVVQKTKNISSKEKVPENKQIITLEKSINEKLTQESNAVEDRSAGKCIKPKKVLGKTKSTLTTGTSTVKKTTKLKDGNKPQKESLSKQKTKNDAKNAKTVTENFKNLSNIDEDTSDDNANKTTEGVIAELGTQAKTVTENCKNMSNTEENDSDESANKITEGVIAELKLLSPDCMLLQEDQVTDIQNDGNIEENDEFGTILQQNILMGEKRDEEEQKTAKLLDSSIEMVLGNSSLLKSTKAFLHPISKNISNPTKARLDVLTAERINSTVSKILEISNKGGDNNTIYEPVSDTENEKMTAVKYSVGNEEEPAKKTLSKSALNDVKVISANVPEALFADDESENSNSEETDNTEFFAPILSLDDLLAKKDIPIGVSEGYTNKSSAENSPTANERQCLGTPNFAIELEVNTSQTSESNSPVPQHADSRKLVENTDTKCVTEELNTNLSEEAGFSISAISGIDDISTIDIAIDHLNITSEIPDLLDAMLLDQVHQSIDCMISGKNSFKKWSQDSFISSKCSPLTQTEANQVNSNECDAISTENALTIPAKDAEQISPDGASFLDTVNTLDEVEVSTTTGFDLVGSFSMEDFISAEQDDFFSFPALDKSQSRSSSFSMDSEMASLQSGDISMPSPPANDADVIPSTNSRSVDENIAQHTKSVACDHSYNKDITCMEKNVIKSNRNKSSEPTSPVIPSDPIQNKSLSTPNKSPQWSTPSRLKCTPKPFWIGKNNSEFKSSTPKKEISSTFGQRLQELADVEKCTNSADTQREEEEIDHIDKSSFSMPDLETAPVKPILKINSLNSDDKKTTIETKKQVQESPVNPTKIRKNNTIEITEVITIPAPTVTKAKVENVTKSVPKTNPEAIPNLVEHFNEPLQPTSPINIIKVVTIPPIKTQSIVRIQSQTNRLEVVDAVVSESSFTSNTTEHDLSARSSTPTLDERIRDEDEFEIQSTVDVSTELVVQNSRKRTLSTDHEEPPIKRTCESKDDKTLSTNNVCNPLQVQCTESKTDNTSVVNAKASSVEEKTSDTLKVESPHQVSAPSDIGDAPTKNLLSQETNVSKRDLLLDSTHKLDLILPAQESITTIKSSKIGDIAKSVESNNTSSANKPDNYVTRIASKLPLSKATESPDIANAKIGITKAETPENCNVSNKDDKTEAQISRNKILPPSEVGPNKITKSQVTCSLKSQNVSSVSDAPAKKFSRIVQAPIGECPLTPSASQVKKALPLKIPKKEVNKQKSIENELDSPSSKLGTSTPSTSSTRSNQSPISSPTTKTAPATIVTNNRYNAFPRSKYVYQRNVTPISKPPESNVSVVTKKMQLPSTTAYKPNQHNPTAPTPTTNTQPVKLSPAAEAEIQRRLKAFRAALPPEETYQQHRKNRTAVELEERKLRDEYLDKDRRSQAEKVLQRARLKRKFNQESYEAHYKKFSLATGSANASSSRPYHPAHNAYNNAYNPAKPPMSAHPQQRYVNKFSEIEQEVQRSSSSKSNFTGKYHVDTSKRHASAAPLTVSTPWEPKIQSFDEIREDLAKRKKS